MRPEYWLGEHARLAALSPPILFLLACVAVAISLLSAALSYKSRRHIACLNTEIVELRESAMSTAERQATQEAHAREVSSKLEEMKEYLDGQKGDTSNRLPIWSSVTGSVSLNYRGQVLRLSRKGKSAAEIARDLNVPLGEVELFLKVQNLIQNNLVSEA